MASVIRFDETFSPILREVAEINPRFDRSAISDMSEPVSFVPMASVSEQTGSITSEVSRPISEVLKGFTPFRHGDVLVAKITPCFENGKIAHAAIERRLGFGSTEFHVVRAQPGVLNDRYLYHFLRLERIRLDGERKMTGSAGQRRVPKHFLENLRVPLPTLEEQRRIAAILDKADALRAKRREAIAKLDQLLQSVFLEMFGSPTDSSYPLYSLDELCNRITDGSHLTPTYVSDGVPFLRVTDIQSSDINWAKTKYVTSEEHNQLTKRTRPELGDVLYSKNGTIGIPKLVDWEREFSIFVSLALLKPKREMIRGGFLESFLATSFALREAKRHSKTGTVTNLHLTEIRKIRLPLPPLDVQDRYLTFREEIQSRSNLLMRSKLRIDELMASFQKQAFLV